MKYQFRLEGEGTFRGRQVYRITFKPKKQYEGFDDQQTLWAGEVLVGKADLQPPSVTTHMAQGLPFLVKTMLGTNVRKLGFAVGYARFDDGVYFPVSYGGEFDVRGVFFYKRTFTISLENTEFSQANADSKITYAAPQPAGSAH